MLWTQQQAGRQTGRQTGRHTDRQENQHATGTHLSSHSSSKFISFLAVLVQQVVHTHRPFGPFSFVDLHAHCSQSLSHSDNGMQWSAVSAMHEQLNMHAVAPVICRCVSIASAALLGSKLAEWIRPQKLKRHLLASNLCSRWYVAPLTGAQR